MRGAGWHARPEPALTRFRRSRGCAIVERLPLGFHLGRVFMLVENGLYLALGCAALAILYGIISARWISAQPAGNERMQQIAGALQERARAYLTRQYTTIGIAGAVLLVVVGHARSCQPAIGYLIGAVLSGAAG